MKLHDVAERLKHLPFYLHPTIDAVVSEAIKGGRDIIDVSTRDPEFPAPAHLVGKMQEACKELILPLRAEAIFLEPPRRGCKVTCDGNSKNGLR